MDKAFQSPCRVLLVDDESVIRAVGKAMLERCGCRVDVAANGLQAVEAFSRQRYDLVFMDCLMPEMDGFKAAAVIREREAGSRLEGEAAGRTPIVALTGLDGAQEREHCLASGMDGCLGKPFAMNSLRSIIDRWVVRSDALPPEGTGNGGAPGGGPVRPAPEASFAVDEKVLAMIDALAPPGAEGLLKSIIGLYLDDSAALMAGIREAVGKKDAAALRRAAHTLKSSSGHLGALTFSGMCQDLEMMGRNNALAEAGDRLAALTREYGRVREALERHASQKA